MTITTRAAKGAELTHAEMDVNLTDLRDLKAPLASPALTGTPTAPTAAPGTNSTQLSTTAFVQAALAALVASSPGALDTLNELALALGNDANFATTMTNALAAKAATLSPPEVVAGTTYTFSAADAGKNKVFTNAAGCAATQPVGLPTGWSCSGTKAVGAGTLTIVEASGVTVENTQNDLTLTQNNGSFALVQTSANNYVAAGPFGPVAVGGGAGVTDGTKADIVVLGDSWTFNPAVVAAFSKALLTGANAAAWLAALGAAAVGHGHTTAGLSDFSAAVDARIAAAAGGGIVFGTDFMTPTYSGQPNVTPVSFSSGDLALGTSAAMADHCFGVARLNTNPAAADSGVMFYSGQMILGDQDWCAAKLYVQDAANLGAVIGFTTAVAPSDSGVNNGAWFRIASGVATAKLRSQNDSVVVDSGTTYTLLSGNHYTFKTQVLTLTTVKFSIFLVTSSSTTEVWTVTLTGRIPSYQFREVLAALSVWAQTATASTVVQIDYLKWGTGRALQGR